MLVEGKLYYDSDDGAVYLALDGHIRHVADPPTFSALFSIALDPKLMINIHKHNIGGDGLPLGPPLSSGSQLIRDQTSGAIYLSDVEGKVVKRHITSPAKFDLYQFNWNTVVNLTSFTISGIQTGKDI